jgi:hypothetical protein
LIENTYKLLNAELLLVGDMKLRHGTISNEMRAGRKIAGFVGGTVLAAGLMFTGCDKRGGLTPLPVPNGNPVTEQAECSRTLTDSEGAKRLLSEVHSTSLLLKMNKSIRAEPGETVNLTWKIRVEEDGRANLVGVEAACESGDCLKLGTEQIKSSLPEVRIEARPEDCGCRWDIRTIIESQRS